MAKDDKHISQIFGVVADTAEKYLTFQVKFRCDRCIEAGVSNKSYPEDPYKKGNRNRNNRKRKEMSEEMTEEMSEEEEEEEEEEMSEDKTKDEQKKKEKEKKEKGS